MTQNRRSIAPMQYCSLRWNSLTVLALALAALTMFSAIPAQASESAGGNKVKLGGPSAWTQAGIASYYSDSMTASGERMSHTDLTAAHKTLPMNTLVEVTRVDTGKSVIVRINDRGPFIKGRVIDLSLEGAKRLDMQKRGITKVTLRILPGKTSTKVEEAMAVRDAAITQEKNEFALTLASFEKKADAAKFRERMQAVQIDNAIVKRIKAEGAVKYQVEIPGFSSETEARAHRTQLSNQVLEK